MLKLKIVYTLIATSLLTTLVIANEPETTEQKVKNIATINACNPYPECDEYSPISPSQELFQPIIDLEPKNELDNEQVKATQQLQPEQPKAE